MRLAVMLPLLSGCQLVYPLDEDDGALRFRRVVSADSDQLLTLTFDRPPEIANTDLLIAMVHSPAMDETVVEIAPPGFERLAEGEAKACNDDWHTTFFAATAGDATSYEFTFNMADSHFGLITAYANASRASFVIHRDPDQLATSPVLPVSMTAAGALLWIGGGASQAWTDDQTPAEMVKRGSNRTLAVFDRALPDGAIPEVTISTSFEFCTGIAEIAIEP